MERPASGQEVVLTCTATVVEGVELSLVVISWTGGSVSSSSSPRVTASNQTSIGGGMYTRTLTFSPVLIGDNGMYTCSVSVTGFDEASNLDSVTVVVNSK